VEYSGAMAVLIKRYANRKLYDTEASRYITLKGISELVRAGKEVRVIDNESGEDITPLILSQIVVEGQKQGRERGGTLTHTVLTELIQKGGDALFNIVRRGVDDVADNLTDVREGVRRWMDRQAEGTPFDPAEIARNVHDAVERVLRVVDLPTRSDIETLNKNVEHLAHALEAFEARLRELASELRRPAQPGPV
jgi:polyhydroxyalkanoate synthesis repressor PhaR